VDKEKAKGNCLEAMEESKNQIQKAIWYGTLKKADIYGIVQKEVLEAF